MLVFVRFKFEALETAFFFFFFTSQKHILALGNWVYTSAFTFLLCRLLQGIFAYFISPLAPLPFQLKAVQARAFGEHSQAPGYLVSS